MDNAPTIQVFEQDLLDIPSLGTVRILRCAFASSPANTLAHARSAACRINPRILYVAVGTHARGAGAAGAASAADELNDGAHALGRGGEGVPGALVSVYVLAF